MKKILVIDGNSIINRAYYGVRPLSTKDGKPTNAIFGMIGIIKKQLDAICPDYAAVAFDLKEKTFRHKMYEGYKAGRRPTPEDLLMQFDDAKECLSLMGIHVLETPGYEADDIQGTVARMAEGQPDTESYILTGDRDLLQLINDKTSVLLATNHDTLLMREAEFFEKYGISPENFVDMKALMGDSSDNIPGVAGVGEKTAASLIIDFECLENIYENIDDARISKGVRAKLIADKENAFLSRTLARIDVNAPIGKTLEDLRYEGVNKASLRKKFTELELFSFIPKFELDRADEKETECVEIFCDFIPANSEKINAIKTKSALWISDDIIYIYNKNEGNLSFSGDFSEISEFLSTVDLICYDGKKLWHTLDGCAVTPSGTLLDLMLYAYVLDPGRKDTALASLIATYLSKSIKEGCPAPELMYKLEEVMREKIKADGMEFILDSLELPLIKVLSKIEKRGFKIDTVGMLEYADALKKLAEELTERIYVQAGGPFNINSPKQLGELLFVTLGLPYKKKKTKSGYSTDAETLEELRAYSPIVDDILEYRQVTKLINTYAEVLPTLTDKDSRIHTDFKQALTATGRLSSADPNLQNIPIRTKMGRQMRKYFIAKDGYTLVDADYSQIELRLLAHISGDYNMCDAFKSGMDIHRNTASAVFSVPEEYVTEDMRKRAKAVNFGIVYGISGFSLAKDIGTTTSEANKYIKNYLMNYPEIDIYLENVVKEAERLGYTKTEMGRRRYIPELRAANAIMRGFGKRVAMNAPIQGSAADIMKLAMIKVHDALLNEGIDAEIVMQVHDELVVEVRESDAKRCAETVKREMENAVKLSVPLTVDVTVGKNWLDQE